LQAAGSSPRTSAARLAAAAARISAAQQSYKQFQVRPSDAKVANRDGRDCGWEIATRPLRDARRFPSTRWFPVPGATRTTLGFGIGPSIIQGPFSVAPCQTLALRFAAFLCARAPAPSLASDPGRLGCRRVSSVAVRDRLGGVALHSTPHRVCWEAFCGTGLGSASAIRNGVAIGPESANFLRLVPAKLRPVPVETGSTTASHQPCSYTHAVRSGGRARAASRDSARGWTRRTRTDGRCAPRQSPRILPQR
jgi:hypothetical protein